MKAKNKIKKILLVDDQVGICDGLKTLLTGFGYDVETLTDGNKVLDISKLYKPNLILLDVFLSGVDGRDILKKIKKDRFLGQIPVILMSAQLTQDQLQKETLASGFMSKPFDLVTLKAILKKILQSQNQQF